MSRYFECHKLEKVQGPGDSRPTALQILKDEGREGSFGDKVVVITGTSSGIGINTAQAMAATGATVYCSARDVSKGRAALGSLLDNPKVHLLEADLAHLASVKAFADEIKKRETKVNILINNAGVMLTPTRITTKDGFEMQIGTNHFGHFYLFCQLKELLLAGSTTAFQSRVVNVSSSAHRYAPVQLDDINLEKAYDPAVGYGSSKNANIHMANQIERLYGPQGIHGYSLMPGGIATGLQVHIQEEMDAAAQHPLFKRYIKSADQGAATTVFAAVAHELEGRGGVYLEDCQVAPPAPQGLDETGDGRAVAGYREWAFDPVVEEKLWKLSLEMVGVKE
ncbi:putative oxidoreductase,short chain dehydrogenase [Thozetella sp. PMI_491]|nr:putative oxidoreductase,short chain dehydrogenase [Thozetella sp. PMI_491]